MTENVQDTTTPLAAILFMDIVGYSSLQGPNLDVFHLELLPDLSKLIYTRLHKCGYFNSWGDGLIVVSNDVKPVIQIAFDIWDYFVNTKYNEFYKNDQTIELNPRIAIHTGRVYWAESNLVPHAPQQNPSHSIKVPYGKDVITSARIEPVTPPGRIWITGPVARYFDSLQEEEPRSFGKYKKRSMGTRPLAKKFKPEEIIDLHHERYPPPDLDLECDGVDTNRRSSAEDFDKIRYVFSETIERADISYNCDGMLDSVGDCAVKEASFVAISRLLRNEEDTKALVNVMLNIFNVMKFCLIATGKLKDEESAEHIGWRNDDVEISQEEINEKNLNGVKGAINQLLRTFSEDVHGRRLNESDPDSDQDFDQESDLVSRRKLLEEFLHHKLEYRKNDLLNMTRKPVDNQITEFFESIDPILESESAPLYRTDEFIALYDSLRRNSISLSEYFISIPATRLRTALSEYKKEINRTDSTLLNSLIYAHETIDQSEGSSVFRSIQN